MLAPTETTTRAKLNAANPAASATVELAEPLPVRGSATVVEAARALGTTADDLIQALGLPADTPTYARIGPLLREHGRQMSDLRKLHLPSASRR
jgi:hypothetical protein